MRGSRHRCRACHGIYSAERNIIDASACGTSTDTTRGVCAVPRPFGLRWGVTRRQLRRIPEDGRMEWTFTGEVIEWRGPAPYLFVAMTSEDSEDLKEEARGLIYWGQVLVLNDTAATEIYAQLHEPKQAVAWLQQTAATGFPCYPFFERDRALDPIRQDPRFIAFVQKLKPEWQHFESTYGSGTLARNSRNP